MNRSSHFNDSKLSGTQGNASKKKDKKSSVLKERKISLGQKKKARYIPIEILAASEVPAELQKDTKSRIIRDIKDRKKKQVFDLNQSRQLSKYSGNPKQSVGPISSVRTNDQNEGQTVSTSRGGQIIAIKKNGDQEVAVSINSRIQERELEEQRKRSQSPYQYQGLNQMGGLYKKVHREIKKQLIMRQSSSQNNMKREIRAGKVERVRTYSKNKKILDNSFQEQRQNKIKYIQNGPHSFGSSRSQSAHRSFFQAKRSPPTRETTRFTNKMESLIHNKAENMLLDPREGYPYNREQYDLLSSEEGNLTHHIYSHDNAEIDVTEKFHNQSLTNLKSGSIERSYESKRQNSRKQERPLNISKKVKIEHQKPFGVDRTVYQHVNKSLISKGNIKMKKPQKSEERAILPTLIQENRPVTSVKAQRPQATLLNTRNEGGKRIAALESSKDIQIPKQKKTKQQLSPSGVKIVSISKQDEKMKFDSEYELLRKDSSSIAVPTKTLSSMNKVTE